VDKQREKKIKGEKVKLLTEGGSGGRKARKGK